MASSNEKFKIKVSEVATLLGWKYTTAKSIKDRKSPADKYKIYVDAEIRLLNTKEQLNNELSNK